MMLGSGVARLGWGASLVMVVACGDSGSGTGSGGDGAGGSATGGTSAGGGVPTGDGNFVISPPYDPAPETIADPAVPQGTVSEFTMSSTTSTIYPTDIATGQPFDRSVAVYVPSQYVPGTAAPFMVVQDGRAFYESTMVPVLDNMIAEKRLPIMIAIFVDPGPDGGTPDGQRSFEYDSVSEDYVNFVESELLPKVAADYAVTFTTDPEGRATMGGSSGGAAAFTMGWLRPDLYHRVLTYSGSFCNLQPNAMYPNGAWSYHESLIAAEPKKPLRVALSASENDLDWNTETDQRRRWIDANEGMARELAAKGYAYRYVYAEDAEHIDFQVLQHTLPSTLAWLWEGYPIAP